MNNIEFLIAKSRVDSLYEMANNQTSEHYKQMFIRTAKKEERKLYKKFPQYNQPHKQLSLELDF